jgi:chromosome partitioning protein
MQKIILLNPKGGSGKSTLAINLASHFAIQQQKPTLLDLDIQGASVRWVNKRSRSQPKIYGISPFEHKSTVTRSFAVRMPIDSRMTIVDTPAGLETHRLQSLTCDASAILVPVLPSDIDIHTAARCISDLLMIAKIKRQERRIAVIANRVKCNTLMYQALMRFLQSLQIPIIATLRDTQTYVRSTESGLGIFEMPATKVRTDLDQWSPLLHWLTHRTLPGQPSMPLDEQSTLQGQPSALNNTPAYARC